MKKYMHLFLITWLCGGALYASNVNVDPQREEDPFLQQEQTHDLEFEEDQNLQQEKAKGPQLTEDPFLQQEQTHDLQFQEDQNFQQEKQLGR